MAAAQRTMRPHNAAAQCGTQSAAAIQVRRTLWDARVMTVFAHRRGAFEFDGFAEVYSSGCTAGQGSTGPFGCSGRHPSAVRLVLVFPGLVSGEAVGLAEGSHTAACAADQDCPLYFPTAASRSRVVRAGRDEVFVSVFIPNDARAAPAALAGGVSAVLTATRAEVTLVDSSGAKMTVGVQLGGENKEAGWRVQR